jgi:hypothetical protein
MKKAYGLITLLVSAMTLALSADTARKDYRKESLKVLAIGNSFSICVLKEMPNVAKDLGYKLDFCSMYIPGCTLDRHAANLDKPNDNPYSITWSYASCGKDEVPFMSALKKGNKKKYASNIERILQADKWDVVTIQQGSHKSWKAESYEPYGTKLINMIRKHAPQAKIYVQQTWSYTPWDKRLNKWGIDNGKMFESIEKSYAQFANAHSLDVIRTGKAIDIYRRELPVKYTEKSNNDDVCGVNTFKKLEKEPEWWPVGIKKETGLWWPKGDVFHLNRRGEYLQALVWTAKLFNADVTKCSYTPDYLKDAPEKVALMKKAANEVAK